jgi:hypothetical protein
MTDRELLEAAAMAAGKEHYGEYNAHAGLKTTGGWWNPLTDDGDALRLAVGLRLVVDAGGVTPRNERIYVGGLEGYLADEPTGADIDAATRRAIVRAAAEIGRNMK